MRQVILWCTVLAIGPLALAQEHADPRIAITDIQGKSQHPFQPREKGASVIFFITNDCPISNRYAPEIHRICDQYSGRAGCFLAYVDPTLQNAQVAKHLSDFRHGDYPAIVDRDHILVKAAGATITPEVAVILPGGKIAYRGRIDDTYVTWGTARNEATVRDLRSALDLVLEGRPVPQPRTKAVGCYITPLEFFKKK
jgi:hypothetical protein